MKCGHRWLIGALVVIALAMALTLLTTGEQDSLAQGDIIYVDADATTGANNGTSWEDAFTDLQPALAMAETGDEIWVAEGIYRPSVEHGGSDGHYKSFQMKNGVALYGGFDPSVGATRFKDRDLALHVTRLSGSLVDSYHVFYHPEGTGLDSSAILNGFTISAGKASATWPHSAGGGMFNYGSSPTLTNVSFEANFAGYGGGLANFFASPALTNCSFSRNVAANGGAMYSVSSSPTLANCTLSDNWAAIRGGGMYNRSSSPVLTNCTLSGNVTDYKGGGMYNYASSSPVLTNCIVWDNRPEQIFNENSTPIVTYSDIQGGYEGTGNIDTNPLFLDPANGGFHLRLNSPCTDVGDNSAPDLPLNDFEGHPRIMDGDCDGTAIVDMGVDEVFGYCVYLPVVLKGY